MITFKDKQKTLFKRKKELIKNITPSEKQIKKMLDDLAFKYVFQKAFIKGDYYCIVDFYLPKPMKLCIEIDGNYHQNKEQKVKDAQKDNYLKSRGFRIIRITNENVFKLTNRDLFQWIINGVEGYHKRLLTVR